MKFSQRIKLKRCMKPAQYNITVKRYVDHSLGFVFPYDISTYTFYAYVLDSNGNVVISYDVAKNNAEQKVTIRTTRTAMQNLSPGTYRWTFQQQDPSNYLIELVCGLWELEK